MGDSEGFRGGRYSRRVVVWSCLGDEQVIGEDAIDIQRRARSQVCLSCQTGSYEYNLFEMGLPSVLLATQRSQLSNRPP